MSERERERLEDDISRCNTVSQDNPREGLVQIKARFNIPAGEEITTSYMRPTQDTQSRRQLLAHTWHFWCCCSRSVRKQRSQIFEYLLNYIWIVLFRFIFTSTFRWLSIGISIRLLEKLRRGPLYYTSCSKFIWSPMTNYLFLLRLIIHLNKYIRNFIWKKCSL